ncbi:hypothetical protein P879_02383 [Paragonimus westermani]|uniref:Protein kinase domain-containing protein n=1 Tax=Paragonimus westermani TaxID=34504 RepID=A0A8T0DJR2_9TREM|nr:hypothetical protein P879_02383 [Paragonimus westermani]
MFGVIPNQGIGFHALIPICEPSNTLRLVQPTVIESHVYKENKLKIAKHSAIQPRYSQGGATDLTKKFNGGVSNGNGEQCVAYSHTFTKKRKAEDANLQNSEESTAPQLQCRYVPASPLVANQGIVNRIGFRSGVAPPKQMHHLTSCTNRFFLPGTSAVSSNTNSYSGQLSTTVSKVNSKSAITQGDYAIVVGEVLRSSNESYEVLAFLGRGTFGQVVKCRCNSSKRCVAIKILKNLPSYLRQGNVEIQILQTLSQQDTESHNIVRAIECFQHKNHMCFVFELLEQNLYEYLKSNKFRPLSLPEIRPIAQQVLTALSKLKSLGLIHADLKPENIMLVSTTAGALRFRVKVIDFGSACHSSKAVQNTYLQSRYYRAPEILLGLPFNEAIDMWSLGCVLAELFLGWPLYPGSSEYDQMRYIVETQGLPPSDLLQSAGKCGTFFVRDIYQCEWRLKTQEEYALETGQQAKEARKYFFTSLDQICEVSGLPSCDDPDYEFDRDDREQFASLLALMLKMRPCERVVPDNALSHRFITMIHLQAHPFSKRFNESVTLMQVCREYTRRQQQLITRTALQQFSSLPSLTEQCASDRGTLSVHPSPISSNSTAAVVGRESGLCLPRNPITQHHTDTAVAYYAAVAALTKPSSQASSSMDRKLAAPNCFRQHYKMPAPSQSTSVLCHPQRDCQLSGGHSGAAILLAHQKAGGYSNSREEDSAMIANSVSVPHSLSLYDLVAAGGNALSLLNAVTCPTSSTFVAATTSCHSRPPYHASFYNSPQHLQRQQNSQHPVHSRLNKIESNNHFSVEQAEQAALMLSSYLDQNSPRQLKQYEPYVSVPVTSGSNPTGVETMDLRNTLNAFVHQQQQQQQQQHLCRSSATLAAVQRQNLMNRCCKPVAVAPHVNEPSALALNSNRPLGAALPSTLKESVQPSFSNSQDHVFAQPSQHKQVLSLHQLSVSRVPANEACPGYPPSSTAIPDGLMKPIDSTTIPSANTQVFGQVSSGCPVFLRQRQAQRTNLIRLCSTRTPSPKTFVQIHGGADALPINLITNSVPETNSQSLPETYSNGLTAVGHSSQSRWIPSQMAVVGTASLNALGQPENTKWNGAATEFHQASEQPTLPVSVTCSLSNSQRFSVDRNSIATSTAVPEPITVSRMEKTDVDKIADCKHHLDASLSSAVSCTSSLRSDKKSE